MSRYSRGFRTMRRPMRRPMRMGPAAFGRRRGGRARLLLALAMAAFALISYCSSREFNPITGETQYLSMTPKQEIALGLQAAPEMIQQHGGLHPDGQAQALVDAVGRRLVENSAARDTEWDFEFHLLAEENVVNAFALPGGPVFITAALYNRLRTEGQLAGVLGHEIGHVVARHSAQRIAKANLTQGITGAVIVASGDTNRARLALLIGQMVNMKYGREDELESDRLGVQFMAEAGYDPRSLTGVMQVLKEATGGAGQPEFFSTHPDPENRIEKIEAAIREVFPDGVPPGLEP